MTTDRDARSTVSSGVRVLCRGGDPRVRAGLAVAAGLVVGAAQLWSSLHVSGVWDPLRNAASPWIVLAFVAAASASRRAESVRLAVMTFLALVVGYYMAEAVHGWSVSTRQVVLWSVLSFVAGPLIGMAAHLARRRTPSVAAAGVGAVGGVLVGEAVYNLATLQYPTPYPFWWAQCGVSLAVGPAWAVWRDRREPRGMVLAVACAVAVTAAAAAVTVGVFAAV